MRSARRIGSRLALPEKCRPNTLAPNLHEFPDFLNALTVLFSHSAQMTMDLRSLMEVESRQVGTLFSASQKGSSDDDSSRRSRDPASARNAICAEPCRHTRTIQHRAGDH